MEYVHICEMYNLSDILKCNARIVAQICSFNSACPTSRLLDILLILHSLFKTKTITKNKISRKIAKNVQERYKAASVARTDFIQGLRYENLRKFSSIALSQVSSFNQEFTFQHEAHGRIHLGNSRRIYNVSQRSRGYFLSLLENHNQR